MYADDALPEINIQQARHIRADSAADWIASAESLASFEALSPDPQPRFSPEALWEQISRWASTWMTGKEERVA